MSSDRFFEPRPQYAPETGRNPLLLLRHCHDYKLVLFVSEFSFPPLLAWDLLPTYRRKTQQASTGIGLFEDRLHVGAAIGELQVLSSAKSHMTVNRLLRLPNGIAVDSLNDNDTLMVYRDIFDDDCYRRHGVTISDGDCIVDVGANTGLFILYLNEILVDAHIYAFEPVPATFQVLRRNMERHNHFPLRLFNVGLSRRSGPASFTYYPRMSNASTMYPDESARAVQRGRDYVFDRIPSLSRPLRFFLALCPMPVKNLMAERVRKYYLKSQAVICELRTLSEVLRQNRIDRVDLLKIDAERSEQPILGGLAEADWPKIRQVVVEVHEGDDATQAMVDLLKRRGFHVAAEPNPTFSSLSLVYATRPRH
jgi:FkbM family methyltransferase